MSRSVLTRRLAWLIALICTLTVVGFWLRDSSLVQVRHVEIAGITGADADAIKAVLTDAALDMTTLHVRADQLQSVVQRYPVVASIAADASLPNRLKITVSQREPVGAVLVGSTRVPVAADGTILRGARAGAVPLVPLRGAPTGKRVSDKRALATLNVLGAAPAALRARVDETTFVAGNLVLKLDRGPELRFGAPTRPRAKWLAAARVLADASSKGAVYIDLATPERPAAGGLEDPAKQRDPRLALSVKPPASASAAPAPAPAQAPATTTVTAPASAPTTPTQ